MRYVSKVKSWSVRWAVFIFMLLVVCFYIQSSEYVNLINIPVNWLHIGVLAVLFFVYKEIYSRISDRGGAVHFLFLLLASILLWFFLTPLITGFLKLGNLTTYQKFFKTVLDSLISYWWIVVAFGVGTAFADQILHWILFGGGESEFTIGTASNGRLLDELIMRALLLSVLLGCGLDTSSVIFLSALSYTIYYLDPFSKNRRMQAPVNMMSGVILGSFALAFGWIFSFGLAWLVTFINFIRFSPYSPFSSESTDK